MNEGKRGSVTGNAECLRDDAARIGKIQAT
jgi:hypothetical protein